MKFALKYNPSKIIVIYQIMLRTGALKRFRHEIPINFEDHQGYPDKINTNDMAVSLFQTQSAYLNPEILEPA